MSTKANKTTKEKSIKKKAIITIIKNLFSLALALGVTTVALHM